MFFIVGKNAALKALVGSVALSLVTSGAYAAEKSNQDVKSEKSSEEKVVIKAEVEYPQKPSETESESERQPSSSPAPSPSPSHSVEAEQEGEHVTPSPSPSASESHSPEAHESEHPSVSPSPSATPTPFPSSTDIFTPAPTSSPTPTASGSSSASPSPSGTPGGLSSPTPTPTVTPSVTPTPTPTPTHSATPTPTPTVTPTASPSASPSGSTPPGPSISPSASPSPSESKLSNKQTTPPAPPSGGNLTVKTPTPTSSPNTGASNYGEDGKLVRLNAPKSTIILTTPTEKPLSNPSPNTGATTNTGSTKFGYDDKGKVAPISGSITLTVGKKKIVENQIVPIIQTLVVNLPKGTVKAEIYINGKKQNATVISGTPFKLAGIIGPKDKVTIRAVDAKGNVVVAPVAYKARPIALANVNFDFSSAKLTPAAIKILDKTISVVRAHGFTSITLIGHTDSKTTKVFSNKKLSDQRSSAVLNYLSKAFAKYKIKVKFKAAGKSDKLPLTSNGTDQGRAINRRVEIEVQ